MKYSQITNSRLKEINMKISFILYTDVYESIKCLSQEEKGSLLDSIYQYAISDKEVALSSTAKMAFSFIKRSIDRENSKWEKTRKERIRAGRIGGLAKAKNVAYLANATFAKQNLANLAVPVPVNNNKTLNTENSYKNKKTSSRLKDVPSSPLTPEFKDRMWEELEAASAKEVSNHGR